MPTLSRRQFVQSSACALLLDATVGGAFSSPEPAKVSMSHDRIVVTGANYEWDYCSSTDTFSLHDSKGRLIVSGSMQPSVVVSDANDPKARRCSRGKVSLPHCVGNRVAITYEGVNGTDKLSFNWRFDEHCFWTDPIRYDAASACDIVSVHYFAHPNGSDPQPNLEASYLIVPSISEAAAISPIVRTDVGISENIWLGRGSSNDGPSQQWGLPVHYFGGFSVDQVNGFARGSFVEHRSDAFACGLAELPAGDLYLHLKGAQSSFWVNYRSDIWHHLQGARQTTLGATLCWSVAADYYSAIAAYYQTLVDAKIIRKARLSPEQAMTALSPEFCTWGSQCTRNSRGHDLSERFLNEIFEDLKVSGMRAGLFSIDDKWEESYGSLRHDSGRFPQFDEFLNRLRSERYRIGLWAALMRCEHPEILGLTTDNMLKMPDGKPFAVSDGAGKIQYYILDFTQPAVAKVLEETAQAFIRRYKPDLVKFDFGYELPSVDVACPQDKKWCGERLMWKGLDIAIRAMRREKPDLVVMYYQLSPLFIDFIDLCSLDDLWENAGEYDLEANRRCFFSSLLGRLGIPTYSSSGYDWASSPGIWFDGAVLGAIGSVNDFQGDERGEKPSPDVIAKFNGLTHAVRKTTEFETVPLSYFYEGPTLGAHPRSWARFEHGELVMLALRPTLALEAGELMQNSPDERVGDVVRSTFPVVVASKTDQSIGSTSWLAIVPYGNGDIVVRHESGTEAQVVVHSSNSEHSMRTLIPIEGGMMKIVVPDSHLGAPLEWIEVRVR